MMERVDEIATKLGIDYIKEDAALQHIDYPVTSYLDKIKSHNFDKNPHVEGTLLGIKAQYLIFDTGVINIRKFAGYKVTMDF